MQKLKNKKIVLASGSPRRKDLLNMLGLKFDISVSDTDESIPPNQDPKEAVKEIAKRKSQAVFNIMDDSSNSIVIGADTIVVSNDKILGKPKSKENAFEILKFLSGKNHQVLTGVAMSMSVDNTNKCITGVELSQVKFRNLYDQEIYSYIETGEPMDKAGAYALQGIGSVFVEKINGCYTNVIGLPVPMTVSMLRTAGVEVLGCI